MFKKWLHLSDKKQHAGATVIYGFRQNTEYNSVSGKWENNATGASFLSGEVATFALLPSAVGRLNQVYFVQQSTGVWFINRKSRGLYISDNTDWLACPEIEGYIPTAAQGNLTEATSSVLTITGGTSAVIGSTSIQVKKATALVDGYLAAADFSTFNNKLPATSFSGLAKITVGTVTPVAPSFGDLWIDTN